MSLENPRPFDSPLLDLRSESRQIRDVVEDYNKRVLSELTSYADDLRGYLLGIDQTMFDPNNVEKAVNVDQNEDNTAKAVALGVDAIDFDPIVLEALKKTNESVSLENQIVEKIWCVMYTNTRKLPHKTGIDLKAKTTRGEVSLFHFHNHSYDLEIVEALPEGLRSRYENDRQMREQWLRDAGLHQNDRFDPLLNADYILKFGDLSRHLMGVLDSRLLVPSPIAMNTKVE